jgi:predicted Zn finger-like uncharacterized protein
LRLFFALNLAPTITVKMSLKTRCPACDTVFKIVPDQLKVSSGWVRCGRCAEVFDAASHAAASDATTHWPQPIREASASFENTPNNIAIQVTNTTASANILSDSEKSKRFNQVSTDEEKINLSFVKTAQSKAFWLRTSVVRGLRAVCVALLGLLFFQVVFSQRHHISASNPSLKAGFTTFCQTLGCTIEPFKNIDAFKIDSSSFQKSAISSADTAQTQTFALKLALKNSADIAIAMPAVELTLTDTNDKAVMRRVLLAKDLGFHDDTLTANNDWSGSLTLAVTPSSNMPPITGYRVLLFYP